jgi:hypothetical protein
VEGDRSPAFALDGQHIVYTTDQGTLAYHTIGAGMPDEPVPPDWKYVYSPDWSPPPPDECVPSTACY